MQRTPLEIRLKYFIGWNNVESGVKHHTPNPNPFRRSIISNMTSPMKAGSVCLILFVSCVLSFRLSLRLFYVFLLFLISTSRHNSTNFLFLTQQQQQQQPYTLTPEQQQQQKQQQHQKYRWNSTQNTLQTKTKRNTLWKYHTLR